MSEVLEEMVGGADLYEWLKEVVDNNDKNTTIEIIGKSMILVEKNARIDATTKAYETTQSILNPTKG